MNNSELYKLDVIARQYLIKPDWKIISSNSTCSRFQAKVRFSEKEARGQGESKKSVSKCEMADIKFLNRLEKAKRMKDKE